jgi:hypothetical protein
MMQNADFADLQPALRAPELSYTRERVERVTQKISEPALRATQSFKI